MTRNCDDLAPCNCFPQSSSGKFPLLAQIVLSTLNARYSHSSFGLRYLLANMGDCRPQTTMLEFTINDNTVDMLSAILEHSPRIVGFGVYIWNVEQTSTSDCRSETCSAGDDCRAGWSGSQLRHCRSENCRTCRLCDHRVKAIMRSGNCANNCCQSSDTALNATSCPKIIHAPVPQLDQIQLPYDLYSDEDIANRVIYVEASRGCPFTCEFCLSALEIPVRLFDIEQFLAAMQTLFDRGARHFKFVDRTFNLNLRVSRAILQFFLDRSDTRFVSAFRNDSGSFAGITSRTHRAVSARNAAV